MPRRDFIEALRRVATKYSLDFQSMSHDWIIQISDPTTARKCTIFGYTFDLNPAGAVEICREKAATSLVLDRHGVPNVPHRVFLSAADPFTKDYVPSGGNWSSIQALVKEWNFPVVLKPLKGTGGTGVTKCVNMREVEGAVQQLHAKEYGLAVSPFKRIMDEYRCICLDGRVELVYKKIRSHVLGDGHASVGTLVARHIQAAVSGAEMQGLAEAAAQLRPEELAKVPDDGEAFALQWRHNLGHGAAVDFDIPAPQKDAVISVALRAASAIGIRFCSADIVDVGAEGLMVMEVNSGVMTDSLIGQLGDGGVDWATNLYAKAVLRSLGREHDEI